MPTAPCVIDMTRPDFSIVSVSLNGESCLRGAIESVLAQSDCGAVEHIVVHAGDADSITSLQREFPHIRVVREQALSRSQALNSGFAMATGEILSWLEGGDTLEPGALARVRREIERHPVVMGACGVCDEQGGLISQIDNTSRSWFDTMKYWVVNSIPTAPAVFFKREILEQLNIDAGEAFDESLHFAMDFDLWLRLQEAHPFSLSLSEILARRPQSQLVSRGSDAAARHTEMSRVFRRHASRRVQPEQNVSFIVPIVDSLRDVRPLLEQLAVQTLPSLEVVVVDASGDPELNREMLEGVRAQVSKHRDIAFQYIPLGIESGRTLAAAYDAGARSARSHIVACLAPSRKIPETFAADVFRCFSRDEIGLVLPSVDDHVASKLFISKHGTEIFNPAGPFTLPSEPPIECVVRKLAWIDSGGFSLHDRFPDLEFSVKRLMVMLAHKAWRIVREPLLEALAPARSSTEEPFRLYENSVVVDEIARELRRNPFSIERAQHGYGLILPDELWQSAQMVMQRMPEETNATLVHLGSDVLRAVAEKNPVYGPVLFCLAEALEREGRCDDAERVWSQWRKIHESEKSSPLYGSVSS